MSWKFEKTVPFNLYEIGDRPLEDVIYNVTIVINDTDKIFVTSVEAQEDAIPYLESLGGPATVGFWQQRVLEHFQNEANTAEVLGEAMTEDEFNEFEDALMGRS